jgi:hypothetical protein
VQPPKQISSYFAAAGLAAITLITFFVFRNFGPQSAVRRLHLAVAQLDRDEINRLTLDPLAGSPETQEVISFVRELALQNVSFEIVTVSRVHQQARVTVQYRLGRYSDTRTWIAQQKENEWRIDCRATEHTWRKHPGTGY